MRWSVLAIMSISFTSGMILFIRAFLWHNQINLKFDTPKDVKVKISLLYGLSAGLVALSMPLCAGISNDQKTSHFSGLLVPSLFFLGAFTVGTLGSMYQLIISHRFWYNFIEKNTKIVYKPEYNLQTIQVYKISTAGRKKCMYIFLVGVVAPLFITMMNNREIFESIKASITGIPTTQGHVLGITFLSALMLLESLIIFIVSTSIFFANLRITPYGVDYRRWPLPPISAKWEDIEKLSFGETMGLRFASLYVRRTRPGVQIQIGDFILSSRDYKIIPVQDFQGWSDGTIAWHIRMYAPHLMRTENTPDL